MKQLPIAECLHKLRKTAEERGAEDCLYRGEASIHKATRSSHHRLFNESKRFTDDQAKAVKERLLFIATCLEVVGLGRPLFASADDAQKHSPPSTLEGVNEVIYCFMQHYHLATPFIDLTTDLNSAASFAADGPPTEGASGSKRGVIYLISKESLLLSGYQKFDSTDSRATRPRRQKAVSLFLKGGTNFQDLHRPGDLPRPIVTRFEFEDTFEHISEHVMQDIYDATGDSIAGEVASLTHRCAYGDLASKDPSHGRVTEYFAQIWHRLVRAGAVPTGHQKSEPGRRESPDSRSLCARSQRGFMLERL